MGDVIHKIAAVRQLVTKVYCMKITPLPRQNLCYILDPARLEPVKTTPNKALQVGRYREFCCAYQDFLLQRSRLV